MERLRLGPRLMKRTYGWGAVELLADIDFEVGPENRVWLSVYQREVLRLEPSDFRHGKFEVEQVVASHRATLNRVVKEGAEDGGNDLGVGWELAKLPRAAAESGNEDPGGRSFEPVLSESLLVLTELVGSLEDVAFFVAVDVAYLVHARKNSRYLAQLLAEAHQLGVQCRRQFSHTQRCHATSFDDSVDEFGHGKCGHLTMREIARSLRVQDRQDWVGEVVVKARLWLELKHAVLVAELDHLGEGVFVVFEQDGELVSQDEVLASERELLNVAHVCVEL